jgi:hypothetical protein
LSTAFTKNNTLEFASTPVILQLKKSAAVDTHYLLFNEITDRYCVERRLCITLTLRKERWITHMEWMNRGTSQGQPAGQPASQGAPTPGNVKTKSSLRSVKTWKIAQVALLFCITVLVVAVVWFVALGGGAKKEASYVDNDRLQAVFLNGGQVYFGKINDLNGKFLSMSGIYYLRVNQQVQPNQSSNNSNDISLVKLGCELHGPQDNMVINREQVIFWENLKDDGQVAKAVKTYQEQNPGEQKCEQQSSTPSATENTSTNTPNTNTTTNNAQNN